ncbi:hypothetical protein JL721_9256 [Aureococcus anophagefferens]|nr:hypothetical protein JL721_9256 [Aureococcus anophagefferens]
MIDPPGDASEGDTPKSLDSQSTLGDPPAYAGGGPVIVRTETETTFVEELSEASGEDPDDPYGSDGDHDPLLESGLDEVPVLLDSPAPEAPAPEKEFALGATHPANEARGAEATAARTRRRRRPARSAAPLSKAVVLGLMLPSAARGALERDPRSFATAPLGAGEPTLRCVVSVLDRRRRGGSRGGPLLALRVQGYGAGPLLLAAAKRASSRMAPTSRLARRFDISCVDADGSLESPGAVVASVNRDVLGTRWTVCAKKTGKTGAVVDYAVNRLANRPRSMLVRVDDLELRSRAPEYNPRLQGFCLDFFGRARLASVRNFQLVDGSAPPVPNDPDAEAKCKLLFGRWSDDEFHLDVKHPFSPADAFAVAVSSFATKLATI